MVTFKYLKIPDDELLSGYAPMMMKVGLCRIWLEKGNCVSASHNEVQSFLNGKSDVAVGTDSFSILEK